METESTSVKDVGIENRTAVLEALLKATKIESQRMNAQAKNGEAFFARAIVETAMIGHLEVALNQSRVYESRKGMPYDDGTSF